jgi:hypothetical protein
VLMIQLILRLRLQERRHGQKGKFWWQAYETSCLLVFVVLDQQGKPVVKMS